MRELTRCADGVFATQLQHALDAAGIEARISTEVAHVYLGTRVFVVWVVEGADPEAIKRAYAAVTPSDSGAPELRPSRVCVADSTVQCCVCGYDLRGQIADGNCPECGHPYRLLGYRPCPTCGVDLPTDFEICWNCGGEVPLGKGRDNPRE